MRSEESYSYKTSSSKLVQVAEIASRYKGRPEMLMKVIIQVQRIVPAFRLSGIGDQAGNGDPTDGRVQLHHLLRHAFRKAQGQIHHPYVQERPLPCERSQGDRAGAGRSFADQNG